MSNATRVKLTVGLGLAFGVLTWVLERSPDTGEVHDLVLVPLVVLALIALFVVPFLVGRVWVVLALLGPLVALAIMQVAGLTVSLDDGTGPAFNYRTTFQLVVSGFSMVFMVGLRGLLSDIAQSDQPG